MKDIKEIWTTHGPYPIVRQNQKMTAPIFDITAEIIPGESIGGIKLDTSINEIDLTGFTIITESDFEIEYGYKEFLFLNVIKEDSKIYKICIRKNYIGNYKKLRIGTSISRLLDEGLELKLDFLDMEFELEDVDGLRFGPSNTKFVHDQIPNLVVDYISIFPKDMSGYDQGEYRKINKNDFA